MKQTTLTAMALVLATPLFAQGFNDSPPNTPDFKPAFEGQTRTQVIDDKIDLEVTEVVKGLENPWGLAELPDGGWLVTERPGRLRHVSADGKLSEPITGVPKVWAEGQGGLLDVAVGPGFASDRRIWITYAEPREEGKNATAVASAVLSADGTKLDDLKVIFQQQPAWKSDLHFGSRLVFAPDGALFVTLGERSLPEARVFAQDVSTHLGKVVRLNPEGGAAAGNPEIAGALPEIYTYGHRSPQGAALDSAGNLWVIEHGPRGGDELNRIEPGKNYGWPVITYGQEYGGEPIGEKITQKEGMEQPVYYWDPVIAPSGLTFYSGEMFADWKGSVLTGGLAGMALVRLTLEDGKVTGEARYLQDVGRIRDVAVAADGAVMLITDEEDGALLRVTPK